MEHDYELIYPDMDFEDESPKIPIGPFIFEMTCFAFPERYDVFYKGELCAYARLRNGRPRRDAPAWGGETIYAHHFEDERGGFRGEGETSFYFKEIAAVLAEKMGLGS